MTTLGVISDIHANLPAYLSVVNDLHKRDIDEIVCLGDIIGVFGWPNATATLVQSDCSQVIMGNHDARVRSDFVYTPSFPAARDEHTVVSELLEDDAIDWLNSLPERIETDEYIMAHSWPKEFQDADASIHGFQTGDYGVRPKDATRAGKAAGGKVVMLGHTHEQFSQSLDKFQGLSGVIMNPGSVGAPWFTDPEYAIVDTETQEVDLLSTEYDDHAVKECLDQLDERFDLQTWTEEKRRANL